MVDRLAAEPFRFSVIKAELQRTLASPEKTIHARPSWPWWRRVLVGLSAIALLLSGYLGWHYLVGGTVIGCGVGSPCDDVLNSRWSTIGGILPVSGLAEGAYLAILAASFYIGPAMAAPVRGLAWRAMLVLVGAAAGSAVWFIIVQRWIIGSFCPYCMATHITGLLLAALVIWRAPLEFAGDWGSAVKEDSDATAPPVTAGAAGRDVNPIVSRRLIGRMRAVGFALAGVGLAGILAACQAAFSPPPVYRVGESRTDLALIDPHAVPLAGSPDATYVVSVLFDYKCPHCQRLHFMLDEAIRRYGGKLAFALCPTPLNRQCNPYIPGMCQSRGLLRTCQSRPDGLGGEAGGVSCVQPLDVLARNRRFLAAAQPRSRPGQSDRIGWPREIRSRRG